MKNLMVLACLFGFSCHALEVTVMDTLGKPLAGAAVWLEGDLWSIEPSTRLKKYNMGQKDRNFIPHVLIIPQGAKVEFPNFDSILHHVYSFSEPKTFELKLYRDKSQTPINFTQSGVVELGCNIHDWMLGFILVVNSGVYGLTDDQGKIVLPLDSQQLGNASLHVWHERFEDLDKPESHLVTITDVSQKVRYQLKQPLLEKIDLLTGEADEY
jgi:plastocyanin